MPDQTPQQFPHYEPPKYQPGQIHVPDNHGQNKPITRLLSRALKGRRMGSAKGKGYGTVKLPKVHRYRKKRDL
jgi:hypothetical protein